jgi:cell division protein FtsW (lipid II flippase)
MAYFNRRKKYISIGLTAAILMVIVGISSQFLGGYFMTANLILIITVYSTLLYMIAAGMLEGEIRTRVFSWILSLVAVLAVFSFSNKDILKYDLQQCFYPEEVAQNYFDDAYNSILVRNLVGRAKIIGTIELGQEELKSYFIGEWYFKNMDSFQYDYKKQIIEHGDVKTFEDILPQHYQNNYRIAYWVLKYGWIPSIVLLLIVLAAYGMLIRMVVKIRNKIGKVLSLSCSLALGLQFLIYVMGNLGFQFGWFCNLPFISEGNSSIITNMIFVGLACSAYRYDKVFKEERLVVTTN